MTLADMPVALRRYVTAVILGGLLLAAGVALRGADGLDGAVWVRAVLLVLLAAVTFGRPIRIGHRYSYDVSEVVHIAMVVLFPPWLPGILVLLAIGLPLVRPPWRSVGSLFNLGQAAIYVTAGALSLAALRHWPDAGPSVAGLPPIGAIVVTAVVMLAVNTALVSGAIAFQTGARFWRLWRGEVTNVGGTYTALVALGVVAALIVRDYPLALVPLALPAGMAQYALRREVQLRTDTRAALAALVDVIELRDPYTAGHSERVAALARAIAVRLGLTGEEADLIETAGRVHDLGKVAINPTLLTKPGPLDETEWHQLRQHPVKGAAVVERFAGYHGCAELVRRHHERWNGSGYPDGLAAERIPLGARILGVADAFDAMTSQRPYRLATGSAAALCELQAGANVDWDPDVVLALVELQREATTPALVPDPRPVLA